MKTIKNLIDDINSGVTKCPYAVVETEYKFAAAEIETEDFSVWYTFTASLFIDDEENPCFKESRSTFEIQSINVFDGEGEFLPYEEYQEFEKNLIEAIEKNTEVC